MYFSYSPQRNENIRIDYSFNITEKIIIAKYRQGREVTKKKNGIYDSYFVEDSCCEYFISICDEKLNFENLPVKFIVERKVENDNEYLVLFKPYGPEEESLLFITYPGVNEAYDGATDKDMSLTSSLNSFEKLHVLWREQLVEISSQTYNIMFYLSEEYEKISNTTTSFPSPISIRSFKTSVLQNTILYIEASANYISEIIFKLFDGTDLPYDLSKEIDENDLVDINETNGKHIRLEVKLEESIKIINKFFDSSISIGKGNHVWGNFKKYKRMRDNITHIKKPNHNINPTFDNVLGVVTISDADLFNCIELICWVNCILDDVVRTVWKSGFYNKYNDYMIGFLVGLCSKITGCDGRKLCNKYGVEIII